VARLQLNTISVTRQGLDISAAALAVTTGFTGVSFVNNGNVALVISNGSGSPLAVSEVIGQQVQGSQPPALPVSIPAGKTWMLGSFDMSDFVEADGNTYLDFAGGPTITVGLVQIPSMSGT
jgi:hypothetical protein